jgi:hypothetical protein
MPDSTVTGKPVTKPSPISPTSTTRDRTGVLRGEIGDLRVDLQTENRKARGEVQDVRRQPRDLERGIDAALRILTEAIGQTRNTCLAERADLRPSGAGFTLQQETKHYD